MRTRREEGVTIRKPAPGAVPAPCHPEQGAGAEESAAPRRPHAKTIERRDLCRAVRLSSEADIDAYVADIRKKLIAALADHDSVSVR
jgi:hypothetical protein